MIKEGKLFGIIHIVDVLAILVVIGVIAVSVGEVKPINITSYSSGEEVKVRFEVISYEYNPMTFQKISEGVQLAEDKKYLQGYIKDIEIVDFKETYIDNNGLEFVGVNPIYKKAKITIEATAMYEKNAYKIGNQEIREAKPFFVITEWNNISTVVTSLEVLE